MLIPCIFSVKYNYFASCPDSFLGRTNNHFRPMQLIFFLSQSKLSWLFTVFGGQIFHWLSLSSPGLFTVRIQAARTAASCLGSRSLCFLPGLVTSQNTHHPFVIIWAFVMLVCFQRDREKGWRRERWRNGGGGERKRNSYRVSMHQNFRSHCQRSSVRSLWHWPLLRLHWKVKT